MTLQALKDIFGDCKRTDSLCKFKTSYETSNHPDFYIIDDRHGHPARISTDIADKHLSVTNETAKQINIVKLDCCLFHNTHHSKCDCLLFDDHKAFFVELKDTGNLAGRKTTRKKAIAQLKATIELLQQEKIDLSALVVEAVICFKAINDRSPRVSDSSRKEEFRSSYNVSLTEGNSISF